MILVENNVIISAPVNLEHIAGGYDHVLLADTPLVVLLVHLDSDPEHPCVTPLLAANVDQGGVVGVEIVEGEPGDNAALLTLTCNQRMFSEAENKNSKKNIKM